MKKALTTDQQKIANPVARFSEYSDEIRSLISNLKKLPQQPPNDQLSAILNGGATSALRRLISIKIRKERGLFFTSDALAKKVADRLTPMLKKGCKLLDPACGAGNLLLECARRLPLGNDLDETLRIWSGRIFGYDLYEEFVLTAKLRLTLLALSLHPNEWDVTPNIQPDRIFKCLRVGNSFDEAAVTDKACIVVNPPFGYVHAPAGCKWATGQIQIAAWFLEQLMLKANKEQHVIAILPDVLRSGTRYGKWRDSISSLCKSIELEPVGRFDERTDVDVFIMHCVRTGDCVQQSQWPKALLLPGNLESVISDLFEVRVGTVVPHRDPLEGPIHPYIHSRTAPAWETLNIITEERRHRGRVFQPPFLVIRRTSSPSDKHRCVATVVNEDRPVAVENHLIVLLPNDKSLESCQQLLDLLKSTRTDEWLNTRIRCRHLTVSAVGEIPCSLGW
ncbi:MAG: N-6 DNA methylase [Syntrophobacteraceae bacterium]